VKSAKKRRPAAGHWLTDDLGCHHNDEDHAKSRIDHHRRQTAEAAQRAGQPIEAHGSLLPGGARQEFRHWH
jgi:hypothetical protein